MSLRSLATSALTLVIGVGSAWWYVAHTADDNLTPGAGDARTVALGTWEQVATGPNSKATQRWRVVSLRRASALHPVDGGDAELAPAGGVYVVATLECACNTSDPGSDPVDSLLDTRGRRWTPADVYDDYREYANTPTFIDLDDARPDTEGQVRYVVPFVVADDAQGLGVRVERVRFSGTLSPAIWR